MKAGWIQLLLVTSLSACATRLEVSDISEVKPGSEIGGIPFKLQEPYRVSVHRRVTKEDGSVEYQEVYDQLMVLPSRTRTYAIDFDADFLSDHSLELRINANGTLSYSSVGSTSKATDALETLGDQFQAIEDAQTQRDLARDAADASAAAAATAAQTAQDAALLAAMDAMIEVDAAQVALESLDEDATASQIEAARARLSRARLLANIAYRNLGRAEPFPDAGP